MPRRLWAWLVLVTGSSVAFLLGVVFFAIDRTWELLPFGLVAVVAWVARPRDWRDVFFWF